VLLSAPGALVEVWLERIGRPVFVGNPPELRRAGEDLDAEGLTEFLWDVLYWTWGCLLFAAALGDWAWSLWVSGARDGRGRDMADGWQIVIPLYAAYSAFTTYSSMRQSLGGMAAQGEDSGASSGMSKRQQKLEKRGGQKVQYRS
jgi:SRP-independent targeting protein 2/TMEM208